LLEPASVVINPFFDPLLTRGFDPLSTRGSRQNKTLTKKRVETPAGEKK
jgi:hypothetical protein